MLTSGELKVAYYLCLGLKNKDIADRLSLCIKTVKNHLSSIYRKLKVRNRTEAVLMMMTWDERMLNFGDYYLKCK